MIAVQLLLGGLTTYGDGNITSAGMYGLASQIRTKVPGTQVTIWPWAQWANAARAAYMGSRDTKRVIIGYSGGGSRATWLANSYDRKIPIDLMALYDPSPKWQMQPVYDNVKEAISYENRWPLMFGLGGGHLVAHTNSQLISIAEQHLLVQADQSLHDRTIAAIRQLCQTP